MPLCKVTDTPFHIQGGIMNSRLLSTSESNPANTRHWPNVVLMLARRLRRRPNIKTTLDERLVFALKLPGEAMP